MFIFVVDLIHIYFTTDCYTKGSRVGRNGIQKGDIMFGGMMGSNGMGFGMVFGWIFWLLILAAVIYAVLWVVRQSGSQSGSQSQSGALTQTDEMPLAILKRRYAAGEIDQTQFETMKNHLS
jgi:putative membrane protein